MFCGQCGKEIIEGTVFCPYCGSRIVYHQPNSYQKSEITNEVHMQSSVKTKSTDKTKKFIILIVAVAILLLAMLIIGLIVNNVVNNQNNDPEEKMPDSSFYDQILASGDGYFVVSKHEESYNSAETKIGVITSENEWVMNLSSSNIFGEATEIETGKPVLTGGSTYLTYAYMGDGIFMCTLGVDIMRPGDEYSSKIGSFSLTGSLGYTCYFYNCKNNKSWQFTANCISPYDGDYMLVSNHGSVMDTQKNQYGQGEWLFLVDKNGNPKDLDMVLEDVFSPLSDGVFLNGSYFYDTDGKPVLSLEQYNLVNREAICFIDGKCTINFKNPAGNEYIAVIDKEGNFIEEPVRK